MSACEMYVPFIIRNHAFESVYIYIYITHSRHNLLLLLCSEHLEVWMPTFLLSDTEVLA